MKFAFRILIFLAIVTGGKVYSKNQGIAEPGIFKDIIVNVDTASFSKNLNSVEYKGEKYLQFRFNKNNQVCNIILYPEQNVKISKIKLLESGDFEIIEPLRYYNNQYYDFKVRFKDLAGSDFLKFTLSYKSDTTTYYYDIKLFPVTSAFAKINQTSDELNVGEEKIFEILSNNVENIDFQPDWQTNHDITYRISKKDGHLFAHLIANSTGNKTLEVALKLNKPEFQDGIYKYEVNLPKLNFNVKPAGLFFLQTDKNDILFDEKFSKDGIEIQIESNRLLQLNKTYMVDAQKAPGSPLIATLLLKERLANNKASAILRIFNLHKQTDGYLYIKDGDDPKFITNINIIPKTTINRIRIMRNGKDWTDNTNVYPGETINLRLEGQSLSKGKFTFDALVDKTSDEAIINTDEVIEYKLNVPLNINKREIFIYNYGKSTEKSLTVKEFQRARTFDYVNIKMGGRNKYVSDFQGPELNPESFKDIMISFKPDKIDDEKKIYGKQYFDVDVKVYNKDNELTDFATIKDIIVSPDESSPRYSYYDKSDCTNSEISLNSKLNGNIYSLNDWSKIKMTFRNQDEKYTKDVQSKTIEIILQKYYSFDIDVSFPAGLLINKANESGFGNFGGVSMAVIAQFGFYDEDKIAQYKPYKIGAGFIALNAFNFSQNNSDRDLGAVIIGTLTPVKTNRKFSFPIYLGGGYLLSQKTWFWLIGPGISVNF